MDFTTDQIKQVMAALPGCTDEWKRQLIPMILGEWGRIDVEEHLNRPPPEQVRAQQKLLEKLASCTNELGQVLSILSPSLRFAVAYQFAKGDVSTEVGHEPVQAWHNRIREAYLRFGEEPARLKRFGVAVTQTAAHWGPSPLRHSSVVHYLILQDMATIFEFATDQSPTRRIRTDAHVDSGQDYGPFWNFVSAIWLIVFGSTNRLSYAVRYWAEAQSKHGEWSPVMLNMDLRHPEWRIFQR
jgi:hypothetical protein